MKSHVAIKFPKRVAENLDQFTGRTWLLPKLIKWWEDSDKRVFLLTGNPGSGKSMILAWLARFGTVPEDPAAPSATGDFAQSSEGSALL